MKSWVYFNSLCHASIMWYWQKLIKSGHYYYPFITYNDFCFSNKIPKLGLKNDNLIFIPEFFYLKIRNLAMNIHICIASYLFYLNGCLK